MQSRHRCTNQLCHKAEHAYGAIHGRVSDQGIIYLRSNAVSDAHFQQSTARNSRARHSTCFTRRVLPHQAGCACTTCGPLVSAHPDPEPAVRILALPGDCLQCWSRVQPSVGFLPPSVAALIEHAAVGETVAAGRCF